MEHVLANRYLEEPLVALHLIHTDHAILNIERAVVVPAQLDNVEHSQEFIEQPGLQLPQIILELVDKMGILIRIDSVPLRLPNSLPHLEDGEEALLSLCELVAFRNLSSSESDVENNRYHAEDSEPNRQQNENSFFAEASAQFFVPGVVLLDVDDERALFSGVPGVPGEERQPSQLNHHGFLYC